MIGSHPQMNKNNYKTVGGQFRSKTSTYIEPKKDGYIIPLISSVTQGEKTNNQDYPS